MKSWIPGRHGWCHQGICDPSRHESRTHRGTRPGFFEWLFRDFIRLRYEQNGAITYRKHWFVLVRMTWLPALLIALAVAGIISRLGGLWLLCRCRQFGRGRYIYFYLFCGCGLPICGLAQRHLPDHDGPDRGFGPETLGKVRRRSAPLENVLSIEYERKGLWGYLFNFGTVYISVGSTKLTFDFVYNPSEVQQDIFYRMGERLDQIQQFKVEGSGNESRNGSRVTTGGRPSRIEKNGFGNGRLGG